MSKNTFVFWKMSVYYFLCDLRIKADIYVYDHVAVASMSQNMQVDACHFFNSKRTRAIHGYGLKFLPILGIPCILFRS